MDLSMPPDKMSHLHTELQRFRRKTLASKWELCGITQLLLIDNQRWEDIFTESDWPTVCNSLEKPHHQTRLSKQFYMDLDEFWIPYSIAFNGRAKLIDSRPMPLTSFQCDACLKGYGVYFQGGSCNNCVKPVPDEIIDIVVAARCFGTKWRNLHVVVYTGIQTIPKQWHWLIRVCQKTL